MISTGSHLWGGLRKPGRAAQGLLRPGPDQGRSGSGFLRQHPDPGARAGPESVQPDLESSPERQLRIDLVRRRDRDSGIGSHPDVDLRQLRHPLGPLRQREALHQVPSGRVCHDKVGQVRVRHIFSLGYVS